MALFVAQVVQNRIPNIRANVGPHVLIQALSWPASMLADFQCFPYFNVVGEASFLLPLHFCHNFEVSVIKLLRAALMMLGDTGMAPLFVSDGSTMLFPSLLEGPGRLANIY